MIKYAVEEMVTAGDQASRLLEFWTGIVEQLFGLPPRDAQARAAAAAGPSGLGLGFGHKTGAARGVQCAGEAPPNWESSVGHSVCRRRARQGHAATPCSDAGRRAPPCARALAARADAGSVREERTFFETDDRGQLAQG
jgi:hypothetical protein